MAVTFFDYLYQNTGMGRRVYSGLENQITIDLYTDIGDDLFAASIPPLQNPNPSPIPADDWARVFTCYSFLRVTSSLDGSPFYATPEPRYKVGNYSYICGRDIIVNEDETIQDFPYYSSPEYVLYDRTYLKPSRFVQIKAYNADIADLVNFDDPPPSPTASEFYYLTSFYFGSNALDNGYEVALNINPGYTCSLVVYYTWGTLQLSGTGSVPKIIFPY